MTMMTTMTTTMLLLLLVVMTGAAASADVSPMPSPSQPPCGLCPPGHHVSLPCSTKASEQQQQQLLLEDTSDVEARCTPCPPRHYTQFWNSLDRCLYCGPPCKEGQRLAKECSPTHDRVCECEPGTFLMLPQEFCERHSGCAAGHGVVTKGSPREDTRCAPCPRGFFSPEASADAPCRPHTNCSGPGSMELLPGASTHDALCWSGARVESRAWGRGAGRASVAAAASSAAPARGPVRRRDPAVRGRRPPPASVVPGPPRRREGRPRPGAAARRHGRRGAAARARAREAGGEEAGEAREAAAAAPGLREETAPPGGGSVRMHGSPLRRKTWSNKTGVGGGRAF
ncbi:uncharacterized protein LOC142921720 [Petromyzon marinus]|uniref:uncharacterized protein LOC142909268 n=1 Tax=Petromyzon marinus TaxID=7757 RepID=UPI003F72A708